MNKEGLNSHKNLSKKQSPVPSKELKSLNTQDDIRICQKEQSMKFSDLATDLHKKSNNFTASRKPETH